MKRLLCIVTNMNTGGAETFLMKIYRQLDRTKYQMDFCICNQNHNFYEDEIRQLGGVIYHLPIKSKHPISFYWKLYRLIQQKHYTYVLRLGSTIYQAFDLYIACLAGAKIRAFRSCNANAKLSPWLIILHKLLRKIIMKIVNVKIAPSDLAGQFAFGAGMDTIFINNGLDTSLFRFSAQLRQEYRTQFNMNNQLVIGHIGRFNDEQKNHLFLIDIFHEIVKKHPSSILCLVGTGARECILRDYVKELHLDSYVKFLGQRNDIAQLLNAFDIFVFPSLFEGMPNTVIEAQTNGVPCLISNTITKQVGITDWVYFMSLKESAKKWAEKALTVSQNHSINERSQGATKMCQCSYDSKQVVKHFEKYIFQKK